MPIYEYRCNSCNRKSSVYVKVPSESMARPCTHCGSTEQIRLFSSFMVRKTYKDVYDDILSDNDLVKGMMANDSRALATWSRKMEGTAEQETGPEYQEMMQRIDKGESWQNVVTDMKESGLDDGSAQSELSD